MQYSLFVRYNEKKREKLRYVKFLKNQKRKKYQKMEK